MTLDDTHRALRDLKGLECQEARRIIAHLKIFEAQEMPWLHVKKLGTSPSHEPVYPVHIGSFRILVEFDFEGHLIAVDEVSPQKTSYRDFRPTGSLLRRRMHLGEVLRLVRRHHDRDPMPSIAKPCVQSRSGDTTCSGERQPPGDARTAPAGPCRRTSALDPGVVPDHLQGPPLRPSRNETRDLHPVPLVLDHEAAC
jgi:mRNA-degrading endonuclease RelE of RelBE toxin-antitoxin system